MFDFLSSFNVIEIIIISFICCGLFFLVRGTRAIQGLKMVVIIIIASFICQMFNLTRINLILKSIWMILPLVFVILFQPELRQALGQLDKYDILKALFKHKIVLTPEIVESIMWLSGKKRGALIVLKQTARLNDFVDTGIKIDARISSELLNTIFASHSQLHDGAVIIEENRISAAGCVLPLSQNPKIEFPVGTRHRAAVGLSEETDAIVIVISEETGHISLAIHGQLVANLDKTRLTEMLTNCQKTEPLKLGEKK